VIYVGTSGWQYDWWKHEFYEGASKAAWLERFAARFPVVEVNNSFYQLPREETFHRWRTQTPNGFLFAVKASRYITHIRRLRDAEEPVRRFWSNARRLGPKLGPVLFQLPPNLKAEPERLEALLRLLPPTMRAAFEFRHPSWATDEVTALLDRAGAALVLADRPGARVPQVITGGWTYLRFHQGSRTGPDYARPKLRRYADRLTEMDAREAWVFFNNDSGGAAVRDAITLTGLLRDRGATVRGPAPEQRPRSAS
jgi:uncharacterized protein YecE (DUF72 family)